MAKTSVGNHLIDLTKVPALSIMRSRLAVLAPNFYIIDAEYNGSFSEYRLRIVSHEKNAILRVSKRLADDLGDNSRAPSVRYSQYLFGKLDDAIAYAIQTAERKQGRV